MALNIRILFIIAFNCEVRNQLLNFAVQKENKPKSMPLYKTTFSGHLVP